MLTIGVCTSAKEFNVKGLLSKLTRLSGTKFKFIQLPYNDLDSFQLEPGSIDGLVLCHSIHNRRFTITDVLDSLYDKFLPYARKALGKENIAVIAHDFDWPMGSEQSHSSPKGHAQSKKAQMDSFRIRQPTTFQCSSLAMVCGKLDTEVQMDDEDWQRLETFVANVRPRSQQEVPRSPRSQQQPWAFINKYIDAITQTGIPIELVYFCIVMALLALAMFVLQFVVKRVWAWLSAWCFSITVVVLLVLFLVPLVRLVWVRFIVKGNQPPRHWSKAAWWMIHFEFWKYYLPVCVKYVRKFVRYIYSLKPKPKRERLR